MHPWFDADSIIHGGPDALLAAEISFCGLDRDVVKQELYLLSSPPAAWQNFAQVLLRSCRADLSMASSIAQQMMQKFEVVDR